MLFRNAALTMSRDWLTQKSISVTVSDVEVETWLSAAAMSNLSSPPTYLCSDEARVLDLAPQNISGSVIQSRIGVD